MTEIRVIEWSDDRGNTVAITPNQQRILEAGGWWPRSEFSEYCQVHRGLHVGDPTWTDDEVRQMAQGD